MRYKKAKKIVIDFFTSDNDFGMEFGWKFRLYPRLRKQMKQWAMEIKNEV